MKKEIGLLELTGIGVGGILGAGIYALIGPAAGLAGNAVWVSFILGAVISSFTGLSYAELSTMFPRAAAEYVYAKNSFNSGLWAFLLGWIIIFVEVVAASTVALGFSGYLKSFWEAPLPIIAILLIGALSLLNFAGIKISSRINVLFTGIEMLGLALIIFLGLGLSPNVNFFETSTGIQGVFFGAALIFFAYLGFEDIVNLSEETENPRKNIPRAIFLSIAITTIIYVFVALSTVSLADFRILESLDAPLAYAASTVLGEKAFLILTFIALFATSNTVLIALIVNSRMVYGMAKDRALSRIFSAIHRGRGTPWIAIVVVMIASMIFAALGDLRLIAGITDFGAFIIFASVNFSLVWLRYKQPNLERPFKVPINMGKFPVIPFLGLCTCIFFTFSLDLLAAAVTIATLVSGVIIYWGFGKNEKLICAPNAIC